MNKVRVTDEYMIFGHRWVVTQVYGTRSVRLTKAEGVLEGLNMYPSQSQLCKEQGILPLKRELTEEEVIEKEFRAMMREEAVRHAALMNAISNGCRVVVVGKM